MFIDFSVALKDLEGNVIKQDKVTADGGKSYCGVCKKITSQIRTEAYELTLKKICVDALMADDAEKDGQAKIDKLQLALKLNENDKVDLKAEQITLLKELIVSVYKSPLIVGRSYELLEKE